MSSISAVRVEVIPAWWYKLFRSSLSLTKAEEIESISTTSRVAWRLLLIMGLWFAILRIWARMRPDLFVGLDENPAAAGLVLQMLYVAPFAVSHLVASVLSWSDKKSPIIWFNFFLTHLTANQFIAIPMAAVIIGCGAFAVTPGEKDIIEVIRAMPHATKSICIVAFVLPVAHYWLSYLSSVRALINRGKIRKLIFMALLALMFFPIDDYFSSLYYEVHYRAPGSFSALLQAIDEFFLYSFPLLLAFFLAPRSRRP